MRRTGAALLLLLTLAGGGQAQEPADDAWFQQPTDARALLRWAALPRRQDWEAVAWSAYVHVAALAREEATADVAGMLARDAGNPDALRYRLRLALLDGSPAALQAAVREARRWLEEHPEMPAAHREEVRRNRKWAERELLRAMEVASARSRARLAPLPGLLWMALLAWLLGRGRRR